MATTPPPRQSRLRTPPAPRHCPGYHSYGPYSPRRSERLAGRDRSLEGSMSPVSKSSGFPVKTGASLGNSQSVNQHSEGALSPPHSLQSSPRRKSERGDSHPTKDSRSAHPSSHNTLDLEPGNSSTTMAGGMLPTPVKTPRKKTVPDAKLASRTLFRQPADSDLPSQKRLRGQKFGAFSLESFESDPRANDQAVPIFTDSRDRIPTANKSMDNPFISQPDRAGSSDADLVDGKPKRRKIDHSDNKRAKKVDKSIHREDGLLYVFRGKKVFRRFNPEQEEDDVDDGSDLGLPVSGSKTLDGSSSTGVRPLTRSSIKPRVLFPNAMQTRSKTAIASDPTEEELSMAEDDEEEELQAAAPVNKPVAAEKPALSNPPSTPPSKTTNAATPTSPLPSGRSLRSHMKKKPDSEFELEADSPLTKSFSPFDRWTRTKAQSTPTTVKKRRSGSVGATTQPKTKKIRDNE